MSKIVVNKDMHTRACVCVYMYNAVDTALPPDANNDNNNNVNTHKACGHDGNGRSVILKR